jgi:hypothetical protein
MLLFQFQDAKCDGNHCLPKTPIYLLSKVRSQVSNADYHREFIAHVKTIETYGGVGAIGIVPAFVNQELIKREKEGSCLDAKVPTN